MVDRILFLFNVKIMQRLMRTNSLSNLVFSLLRKINEDKESHRKTVFLNAFFCLEKILSAFLFFKDRC